MALESKTSTVFNLGFANNTILSCFFFFFLKTDLYFLIPAVIAQIFVSTAEQVETTGTSTNEANAEAETQTLTAEQKIRKVQRNLKPQAFFMLFTH